MAAYVLVFEGDEEGVGHQRCALAGLYVLAVGVGLSPSSLVGCWLGCAPISSTVLGVRGTPRSRGVPCSRPPCRRSATLCSWR
jgi:hypothetical protein